MVKINVKLEDKDYTHLSELKNRLGSSSVEGVLIAALRHAHETLCPGGLVLSYYSPPSPQSHTGYVGMIKNLPKLNPGNHTLTIAAGPSVEIVGLKLKELDLMSSGYAKAISKASFHVGIDSTLPFLK